MTDLVRQEWDKFFYNDQFDEIVAKVAQLK